MLNVNALQKTLSAMPLDRLQQYAQLHKNDPYVVAMALSVANTKKEAMAAQQGQAGQQPMPKVVDQDIAGIAPQQQLPENQGIGQLPAPNMQKMAEGGIVAFGDGGEVPRFNGQTGSVPMDRVPPRPVQRMPGDPATAEWDRMYGQMYEPSGMPKMAAEYVRNPDTKTYEKNPVRAEQDMRMFEQASDAYMTNRAAQQAYKNTQGSGSPDEGGVNTLLGNKGNQNVAPAATPSTGLPSLQSYKKEMEDIVYKNADKKEDFLKESAEIDKPVIEKVKSFIDKEGERLKTGKEQDFYMSLIEGGLAAAAGTSPNALQNIAKGFSTGAASYKEALKDFRKATQENSKMEMELAKYEATGKKDALKSYNEAQARRDDRFAQAMSGIMGQELSGKYQLAATREHAAATKANGPLAIYNALGGGDLAKGFQMAKQIEAGTKKDLMTEYTAWLTANPTAGTLEPEKAAAQFLKTKGLFDLATGMQTQMKPSDKPVGKVFQ